MKKKLLSLVLAGAMVASTSVSAFASETTNISVNKAGTTHTVNVTGDVENTSGDTVSGTISVTVPTAVAFTIDKTGEISGGDIEIVNRNPEKDRVEVIAEEFNDPNPTSGIIIVKDDQLDNLISSANTAEIDKRYISLNLQGKNTTVGLLSSKTPGKTGFIDLKNSNNEIETGTSLGTAWQDNNLTLTLTGRAKKDGTPYVPPTNPIRSDFNLVLKIQKVR